MSEPIRSLTVRADGEVIGAGCRARLRAPLALTLLPLPCRLDVWNLSAEGFARLRRARSLTVACGDRLLAWGAPAEAVRGPDREGGALSTVLFSPGLPLWEARISLSVPAGVTASETLRALLAASGDMGGLAPAADAMIRYAKTVDPDPALANAYSEIYARFREDIHREYGLDV